MHELLLRMYARLARTKRYGWLTLLCCLLAFGTLAQTLTVGGLVRDENGEALPGATILEKGTSNGTVTDMNGRFSLTVSDANATLVFSFVGYSDQEVSINGRTNIEVSLALDVTSLQEIVVIGYGEQERQDLTGAVSSIKSEDLVKVQAASLDEAMVGLAAGVQVTSASGEPGAPVSIRIRGGGSLTANAEPLYVVDGFPINNNAEIANAGGVSGTIGQSNNPLAFLNPNDIESLEILKDASATAIYGARGANGVVLITTKRGKAGTSNIDFNVNFGVQVLPPNVPRPLNGQELASLYVEEWVNNNQGDRSERNIPDVDAYNRLNSLGSTNWVDEIIQNSTTANYQLTVSGGNERTRYAMSGNYFNQRGVIKGSNFDRYSARLNIDSEINDFLSVGANIVATRTEKDGVITGGTNGGNTGGPLYQAFRYTPWGGVRVRPGEEDIYREFTDGDLFEAGDFNPGLLTGGNPENPVALTEGVDIADVVDRYLINAFLTWEIVPGLVFRPSLGVDLSYTQRQTFFPSTTNRGRPNGASDWAQRKARTVLNENLLTYNKTIGEHSFGVTGLFSWQDDFDERLRVGTDNFVTDALGVYIIPDGLNLNRGQFNAGAGASRLVSYMLRLNYNFNDRYLFTLTGRADGSSRFGQNNKYGYFPSGSFAWRISEEGFFTPGTINDLKLRISYGVTGNQEIGRYQTLTRFNPVQTIIGDGIVNGVVQGSIPNPDLRWERSEMFNVGVDAAFFNSRIRVTAEYYDQRTDDLLFQVNVPQHTGFRTAFLNIGEIQNRGLELAINAVVVQNSNFNWNIDFNISRNQQIVRRITDEFNEIPVSQPRITQDITEAYTILQVGRPLGNFYGMIVDGVWSSQEEIEREGTQPDANPGELKIRDIDGDGRITDRDRAILGNGQPDFFFGFTNRFAYKNFDLSFLINGSLGQEIANINSEFAQTFNNGRGSLEQTLDRWNPANPGGQFRAAGKPRFENVLKSTSIEDGSFVRLRNIQVGYNVNTEEVSWLRSARIFLTADNLITVTNYSGFDPEVNSFGNSNVLYGVDLEAYPRARTYRMGVNIGL